MFPVRDGKQVLRSPNYKIQIMIMIIATKQVLSTGS